MSTTIHSDVFTNDFTVTHPFSPLYGRKYEFIVRKLTWGEDRVYYIDENGDKALMPTSWTNLVKLDPYVVISNGRTPFKFNCLNELSLLIKDIEQCLKSKTKD